MVSGSGWPGTVSIDPKAECMLHARPRRTERNIIPRGTAVHGLYMIDCKIIIIHSVSLKAGVPVSDLS